MKKRDLLKIQRFGTAASSVILGSVLALGYWSESNPRYLGKLLQNLLGENVEPLNEDERKRVDKCFRRVGIESPHNFEIVSNLEDESREDWIGNSEEGFFFIPKRYFTQYSYPSPSPVPLSPKESRMEQHRLRLLTMRRNTEEPLKYFPDEVDYKLSVVATQFHLNHSKRILSLTARDFLLSYGTLVILLMDPRRLPKLVRPPLRTLSRHPFVIPMAVLTSSFLYHSWQLHKETIDHVTKSLGNSSINTALRLTEAERVDNIRKRVGWKKLIISPKGNELLHPPFLTWTVSHLEAKKRQLESEQKN